MTDVLANFDRRCFAWLRAREKRKEWRQLRRRWFAERGTYTGFNEWYAKEIHS